MGLTIVPDDSTPSGEKGKIIGTGELLEKKKVRRAKVGKENSHVLLYHALGTLSYLAAEFHQAEMQRLMGYQYESESGNLYELLEEVLGATKELVDLPERLLNVSRGALSFLEAQLEELCESIAQRSTSNPSWIVHNPVMSDRIHALLRHYACITIAQIPAEDIDMDFVPPQD